VVRQGARACRSRTKSRARSDPFAVASEKSRGKLESVTRFSSSPMKRTPSSDAARDLPPWTSPRFGQVGARKALRDAVISTSDPPSMDVLMLQGTGHRGPREGCSDRSVAPRAALHERDGLSPRRVTTSSTFSGRRRTQRRRLRASRHRPQVPPLRHQPRPSLHRARPHRGPRRSSVSEISGDKDAHFIREIAGAEAER
jgi:hypothetical protein